MKKLKKIIEILYMFLTYDENNEIRFSLFTGPGEIGFQLRNIYYSITYNITNSTFAVIINGVRETVTSSIEEVAHLIAYGVDETKNLFSEKVDKAFLISELEMLGIKYAEIISSIREGYETVFAGDKQANDLYKIEQRAINQVLIYSIQSGCPENIGNYNLRDIIITNHTGLYFDFDALIDSINDGYTPLSTDHSPFVEALSILTDKFFYNGRYKKIVTAYRNMDFYDVTKVVASVSVNGKFSIELAA